MIRRLDALTIAEGIERADELSRLDSMGVEWGQGYLLGAPELRPVESVVAVHPTCSARKLGIGRNTLSRKLKR